MTPDQREEFMKELYEAQGASGMAREQLREHMASLGVEWDGEV